MSKFNNPKMSEGYFTNEFYKLMGVIEKTLVKKAKEYVRNDDRMHNFNRAGNATLTIREKALSFFRLKHIISIDDIRDDLSKGNLPTEEMLTEKFVDALNYYILEYISIKQRIELAKNSKIKKDT